jgi:hypothetical protein
MKKKQKVLRQEECTSVFLWVPYDKDRVSDTSMNQNKTGSRKEMSHRRRVKIHKPVAEQL